MENSNSSKDLGTNNKNGNKKNRTLFWVILAVLIIIVFLVFFLRSCDVHNDVLNPNETPSIGDIIGDFVVGEKQEPVVETPIVTEVPSITFTGYGTYTVNSKNPNLELSNPSVNDVYMVFTVTDDSTGEVIARTGKVEPGNYVYVNVYDFYRERGTYILAINISTFDIATGKTTNGMNQELKLVVK